MTMPQVGKQYKDPVRRFYLFVLPARGCWEWRGARLSNGYCVFWFQGKNVKAHRWAYEHCVAPIAKGMTIDHLCRNRACVNVLHMEVTTMRENLARGTSPSARMALRGGCSRGHLFSLDNTWYSSSGWRICKTCNRDNKARYKARKRLTPLEKEESGS